MALAIATRPAPSRPHNSWAEEDASHGRRTHSSELRNAGVLRGLLPRSKKPAERARMPSRHWHASVCSQRQRSHCESSPSNETFSARPSICQHPSRGVAAKASTDGEPSAPSRGEGSLTRRAAWDDATQRLTAASSIVGLFMMLPQIVKNARLLLSGQSASLAALSWLGYSTGFVGNALLLTYFTGRGEVAACLVQVVGASSTALLLLQVFLAGFMPPAAFAAVALLLLLSCAASALRLSLRLPPAAWAAWVDAVGVLGLAVLPQVLWSTFLPSPSLLPGLFSASCGLLFVAAMRAGRLPEWAVSSWQLLSGWTATLLFMLMPVAQLKLCLAFPERIAGLSAASSLLGIAGNGLMVPRALFTRDSIWLLGCSWGTFVMGWGILYAMWAHKAFPTNLFALTTAALLAYVAAVVAFDRAANVAE